MTAAMRFFASICLPLLGVFAFVDSSGDELRLYQDVLPKRSEGIDLRNIARYLANRRDEGQEEGEEAAHRSPLLLPPLHKNHLHELQLARQKQWNIIEALSGSKPTVEDVYGSYRPWIYRRHLPYDLPHGPPLPIEDIFGGTGRLEQPPLDDDDDDDDDDARSRYHNPRPRQNPRQIESEERTFARSNSQIDRLASTKPQFTYSFDGANLREGDPFAVRPNDPRYYDDAPFSPPDEKKEEKTRYQSATAHLDKYKFNNDKLHVADDAPTSAPTSASPESEEKSGQHEPLVVPINRNSSNDIYFIAIVAGCSAAAMFALVLISLTWCRLQRGAKAAADIEYPAYGVTGPNKDVSPSGDQRLAQSAQMYHFQHQKQQIISMENRTSATRDPGSVSEAESEEENEEGDYTVYECPGLAPTAEMEVKNPLFHDDPTLATPAPTDKEEDDDDDT